MAYKITVLLVILLIVLPSFALAKEKEIYPQPKQFDLKDTVISVKDLSFVYQNSVPEKLKFWPQNQEGKIKTTVSIEQVSELDNLGQEAYLIEIKREDGRIVASSERALFYAFQSFKQIVRDKLEIPELFIVDAPDYPIRGIIEGFYDTPWSYEARKDILNFLGNWKMNTYVYAPKDDPYHRQKWRLPYPEKQLQELQEIVNIARNNYVDFIYAISPGVSIEFTSEIDWAALIEKTTALIDIGVRNFALLLDDIDPNLRSAKDRATYNNSYALAQIDLCNRYQSYLESKIPNHRLIVVPTEYYQKGTSPYRQIYAEKLDKDIIIYSTGYGVVAQTITQKEAAEIGVIWKHEIVYWDNYPVNDYNRTRLHMAPLAGRKEDLPSTLGFTFNPMNEAELSKLPLLTCADYTWNSKEYNPYSSWQKAVSILGGEHKDIYKRCAEQNMTFFNNGPTTDYPTLVELFNEFLQSYEQLTKVTNQDSENYEVALEGHLQVYEKLKGEFVELATIRANFGQYFPQAAKEAEPYLKRLENLGKAGQFYLNALLPITELPALSSNIPPKNTEKYGLAFESYLKGKQFYRYDSLFSAQLGSSSVIMPILDRLSLMITSKFGIKNYSVSTNMPVYKNYTPSQAVDNDLNSYFWSSRGQRVGDYLVVDLGQVEKIDGFELKMGNNNQDYFHRCFVEISIDGITWEKVVSIRDKKEYVHNFPTEKEARYLKVTGESDEEYWVIIRHFVPILRQPKAKITFNPVFTDIVNQIAVEPFFVIEEELTFSLEDESKIALVALFQDPSSICTWSISYLVEGKEFSKPVVANQLVQILPLPQEPIKAIRFMPSVLGTYLRGILIIPSK